MFCIVLPVVLFWESTKWLYRGAYKDAETDTTKFLNLFIGVVLSFIVGISVGYKMGWSETPASLTAWLSAAVGAAVGTLFYGWTLLHLIVFRHAFKLSRRLWSRVNLKGSGDGYRQGRNNPDWLSAFLILAGRVFIVFLSLVYTYQAMSHVQANQSSYFWLGYLTGIAAFFASIGVVIFVIVILGGATSRAFAFFLTVALIVFAFLNWATVKALALGPYNGMTAKSWGDWGYLPGMIVGLLLGGIITKLLWRFLNNTGVALIATLLCGVGTYALMPATKACLTSLALGATAASVLPYVAAGVEFFILVAYVFPLAHIAITHSLKHLENITKLMDNVYQEEEGGYREFFQMVLTLVATMSVIFYAPSLLLTYVVSKAWLAYSATAVIGVGVYTLGGKWLLRTGVLPFGMLASASTGWHIFSYWQMAGLGFGAAGGAFAGIAGTLATITILFPLTYILVRKLTVSWLSALLRNPLLKLHSSVCDKIAALVNDFFQAARHTYDDETPFRDTFLQLANIAYTIALTGENWTLSARYGFALWLAIVISVTTLVAAYVLVGQLFKKYGNGLMGLLAAIVCGVCVGIMVHGAQPFGYWLSVPGGMVGAALTAGAFFPWAYLLLRLILNAISQETWLHPVLVGMHEAAWNRFANLRQDFIKTYRQVRDSVTRLKESFWQTYEEMRKQLFKNRK
jgi:hypothetical protein